MKKFIRQYKEELLCLLFLLLLGVAAYAILWLLTPAIVGVIV